MSRKVKTLLAIFALISVAMTQSVFAGPSMYSAYKTYDARRATQSQCMQRVDYLIQKAGVTTPVVTQHGAIKFFEIGDYTISIRCVANGPFGGVFVSVAGPDQYDAARIGDVFIDNF